MLVSPTGYWGPVTSTVDWCEANYAHTQYIAELANTVSSLAMVAAGAVGLWLHRRVLEARFLLAFALLILVGLGSCAFHGTLHFELQMLDELPMLYLVLVMTFMLLENDGAPRFGRALPAALAAYALGLTYLCTFTRGHVQFLCFQVGFGSLELFGVLRTCQRFWRNHEASSRALFGTGLLAYAMGVAVWFIDLRLCPRWGGVQPQLHAWWHVLVSIGFYRLLLFIALDRSQRLGHGHSLRRGHLAVLPTLR